MLTPEYLEQLPDAFVSLWRQVEDDILRDIGRRISKMDGITDTAEWQAWRFEQTHALRTDVIKLLAKYSGKSATTIRQLMQSAGIETLASDDARYRAAGLSPSDLNQSTALLNLLNAGYRQTLGTWQNLTGTTANTVARQFENELSRAWLQVSSGAFDYKSAIKRAVDTLSQTMQGVTYPSGHHDTLEVACRRAILTGVNQTAAKLQVARMEDMGCEFVEVTAHAGARPEHAAWQGQIYHRGGSITYEGQHYRDFEAATGYGTGAGLCGWNCRHNFYPFFPGLSQPGYTDAELDALNAKEIQYAGQQYSRYEISQMQRSLERKVRAAKKLFIAEDAAGLDTVNAAAKLSNARQKLKQFTHATQRRVDSARLSVYGFGHSQASKAVWAVRHNTLTNAIGHTIIKIKRSAPTGPANGITQKVNAKGGIDRNYYGADGKQVKQISNNGHGHKVEEALGRHGEHAHDYWWDENGKPHHLAARELTDKERKENDDIL